jgi:hypothetical protein
MDSETNGVLNSSTRKPSNILSCMIMLFLDKPAKMMVRDATGESSLIQKGIQKHSMEPAYDFDCHRC